MFTAPEKTINAHSSIDRNTQTNYGKSYSPPSFALTAGPMQLMQDNGNCDLCKEGEDCKESEELHPMGNQVEKIQEGDSKPEDLPSKDLEEVGKNAIEVFGYNRLVSLGGESGLVDPSKKENPEPVQAKMQGDSGVVIQRNAGTIARGAVTVAGVISQLDSPLPGPADLVALGVLAVGLLAAGVVYMASKGNQADTGIMNEVESLVRAGRAATVCAALDILMAAARAAKDRRRIQRIKKTQKAKGCRRSRHS